MTAEQAGAQIQSIFGAIPPLTGATVRGISGKVIKIGSTATNTKQGQHTQPGICDGAKARFERANKEGGVNGYTFDFIPCLDDTAAPGPAQQNVQQLVEGDKVFAIVENMSATGNLGSYYADQHVPYFGFSGGPDYCGWADKAWGASVFGESLCATPIPGKTLVNTSGLTAFLAASGKKAASLKMAVYANSDPYGKAGLSGLVAAAKAAGISVVYSAADLPSATEPPLTDFTPVASKIIASGANIVVSGTTNAATLGVTGALKASGYTGDLLWGTAAPALLQDPATAQTMDGTWSYLAQGSAAFGGSGLDQVNKDLKAIGSTYAADETGSYSSYVSADIFIEALKQVQGDLTAEKIMNVVNGGFTYKGIPGYACARTYPAARILTPNCAAVVRYDATAKKLDAKSELETVGGYLVLDS
jgi:branched-chain amino acid transport system substrate-binding protein